MATSATGSSSLPHTVLQWIAGANIPAKARKFHLYFWIGVVIFYVSQFFAGVIDFNSNSHGPMLIYELSLFLVMAYLWTFPDLLAAEFALAASAAASSAKIDIDEALVATIEKNVRYFLNVAAYTIGLVVTVLIIFDIKKDFGNIASLLILGTFLGVITGAIGAPSKIALQIAQSGLIAAIIKTLLLSMPGNAGESILRDLLVSNATPIAIIVGFIAFFGTGAAWGILGWFWNNILSKLGFLFTFKGLIGVPLFILLAGIIWFVAYNIKDPVAARKLADDKVAQFEQADRESAERNHLPPPTSQAEVTKTSKTTSVTIDESQWEKLEGKTKTCEIAWNNKDFKNGWCGLYQFPPGEYRFEVKSSLKFKGLDNTSDLIPQEGVSINRWDDAANTDFVTHFKTWTPVKNDMLGSVIFKTNEDTPTTNSNFNIKQKSTVYISINFPQSQDNWEKMGFNGSITVVIFKKKS